MAVTLTKAAIREISNIVKQQELDPTAIRLRVGVKGGGCSGFSYLLDLTESQRESDELWEYDNKLLDENEDGKLTIQEFLKMI